MKMITFVLLLIVLNLNLEAGIVNWSKKKIINITKNKKTKDYGK